MNTAIASKSYVTINSYSATFFVRNDGRTTVFSRVTKCYLIRGTFKNLAHARRSLTAMIKFSRKTHQSVEDVDWNVSRIS